ncbi:MAG: hypothetical protein JO317_03205 [Verrucomicrobiae bacterium]|nr:hypothetical protein [Verrucomicrobiae bacterium]
MKKWTLLFAAVMGTGALCYGADVTVDRPSADVDVDPGVHVNDQGVRVHRPAANVNVDPNAEVRTNRESRREIRAERRHHRHYENDRERDRDGKEVIRESRWTEREEIRADRCTWGDPNDWAAQLSVPADRQEGGKETEMRYVCAKNNRDEDAPVPPRNFGFNTYPDAWANQDVGYSLTRSSRTSSERRYESQSYRRDDDRM